MAVQCHQYAEKLQHIQVKVTPPLHIYNYNNRKQCLSFYLHEDFVASYQLFTCKSVRLVCAAICLFSSSVGYGCWKKEDTGSELSKHFTFALNKPKRWPSQTHTLPHHEMLKEPGAHDVGYVFWQDTPLILGLLVLAVQQGRQVQVDLNNKHRRRREEKRVDDMSYLLLPWKQRETTNYLFLSVARAQTPPQESPWKLNLSNNT